MQIEKKKIEELMMERVFRVYCSDEFQMCLQKNNEYEKEREYCIHDFQHLLDVARLSYMFSLEREYHLKKDVIYAAALLHDVGRWMEYEKGVSHAVAGAQIAEPILAKCGYDEQEIEMILSAIKDHRQSEKREDDREESKWKLKEILYDADKISRNCYCCKSEKTCNWNAEKKNMRISW